MGTGLPFEPLRRPFCVIWLGRLDSSATLVLAKCSGETNMHFQPSILTIHPLSSSVHDISFPQHSIKFSQQFLRDSFQLRAGESVGLLLPGEMFCAVKNLLFILEEIFFYVVAINCEYNHF